MSWFSLRTIWLIVVPLIVFGAMGCGGGSNNQRNTPFNVRWTRATPRGAEYFQRYVATGTDGSIFAFAGSRNDETYNGGPGTVYAINPQSGEIRWRFAAEGQTQKPDARGQSALVTAELFSRNPVYFSSSSTVVVQLPAIRDYPSRTESLYGLNVVTGAKRWAMGNLIDDIEPVGSHLAVVDRSNPREIRLIDPEQGTVIQQIAWTGKNDITELDGMDDAILAFDGQRLACFNAESGTERWAILSEDFYVPGGRKAVFTSPDHSLIYGIVNVTAGGAPRFALIRIDPMTGQELWRADFDSNFAGESRVAFGADGAALLWGNLSGIMRAHDPDTGAKRWDYALGAPWSGGLRGQGVATSMAAGGTVYVITEEYIDTFQRGDFVALDLKTGQDRWRFSSEKRELYGPPALTLDGGLVFIEGKSVVCLEGQ